MPADPATLDDLATAARVLYRLEVRRQGFIDALPDDWRLAVEAMGEDLRRMQRAMLAAHLRETGTLPSRHASTQSSRACRASMGVLACGKPAVWRFVNPEDGAADYACPDHEADLVEAAAAHGRGGTAPVRIVMPADGWDEREVWFHCPVCKRPRSVRSLYLNLDAVERSGLTQAEWFLALHMEGHDLYGIGQCEECDGTGWAEPPGDDELAVPVERCPNGCPDDDTLDWYRAGFAG